jgi:L-alanine-DL-glutamate epimerase-like enolase superfamily enzyme
VSLETSFERVSLPLERPFTISRGTRETVENVLVRVEDGDTGTTGVGAAAPSTHYGETADTVAGVVPEYLRVVESVDDPYRLETVERRMAERVRANPAARAAVSIALHDLVGKLQDEPLYRLWGLDPDDAVDTSYTIGLADTDEMADHAAEAADLGYSVLKVKLGTDRDRAIVAAVRDAAPDVRIRVDANEAWRPKEAIRNCKALAEYDVEFVEQPVPAENPDGLRAVYRQSPLPIAADESCRTLADVPAVADRADVATIKLMKCGGPRAARRMIHAARAHGLEVMLGCMIETDAAISAGAQLAPLLDYADLDGSLLLGEDPYEGPVQAGGRIDLEDRPGTGAKRR